MIVLSLIDLLKMEDGKSYCKVGIYWRDFMGMREELVDIRVFV